MAGPKRLLWIGWGRNVRSESLARRLGAALVQICCEERRLWRYVRNASRTVRLIQGQRPQVVIATNPSIVLGFLLLALRRWYGFKLISDAHFAGVLAFNNNWLLQWLLDFHNARADLIVVTNENHAKLIAGLGTRAYICQDPLPEIPQGRRPQVTPSDRSALLICTFGIDEPYEAVFKAFGTLRDEGFTLFVTGDYRKAQVDPSRFPWVRFLGFLPTDQYYGYLRSVGVVMDLTTFEDCLVCGAYEALAAGKPLIVSRTRALEEYFGDAAVLTDNTSEAIRVSVLSAFEQRCELTRNAKRWVARNERYMDEKVAGLRALILAPDDPSARDSVSEHLPRDVAEV